LPTEAKSVLEPGQYLNRRPQADMLEKMLVRPVDGYRVGPKHAAYSRDRDIQ